MSDVSHTPCYFESQVSSAEGAAPDVFEWKAWVYSDDRVMWELRRPVMHLWQRRPIKVSCLLKRDLSDWCNLCSAILGAGSVTMSARQVLARPGGVDGEALGDPLIRQEHTCATAALILLLVWFRLHRRKCADRERCLMLGVSLVSRLLSLERQLECSVPCPTTASRACAKEPVLNGVCLCLQTVSRQVAGVAGNPSVRAFEVLGELLAFVDCEGVSQWVVLQLETFGAAIDEAVRGLQGCSDPLKSKQMIVGKARNLRIDEDIKSAYFEAVRDGRAHSVESLQVALADPRAKASRNWIHERMQVAMAAGWVTGARGGCFCIAADGSRFGNLAEETVAYAWCTLARQRRGGYQCRPGLFPSPKGNGITAPARKPFVFSRLASSRDESMFVRTSDAHISSPTEPI